MVEVNAVLRYIRVRGLIALIFDAHLRAKSIS